MWNRWFRFARHVIDVGNGRLNEWLRVVDSISDTSAICVTLLYYLCSAVMDKQLFSVYRNAESGHLGSMYGLFWWQVWRLILQQQWWTPVVCKKERGVKQFVERHIPTGGKWPSPLNGNWATDAGPHRLDVTLVGNTMCTSKVKCGK